jgi:hypothetical protein
VYIFAQPFDIIHTLFYDDAIIAWIDEKAI